LKKIEPLFTIEYFWHLISRISHFLNASLITTPSARCDWRR